MFKNRSYVGDRYVMFKSVFLLSDHLIAYAQLSSDPTSMTHHALSLNQRNQRMQWKL